RECQRDRLSAAAKSGASVRSRSAIRGKAERASAVTSSIAEKQGVSPSKPRNKSAFWALAQTSRPSCPSSGKPSRHVSCRADKPAASSRIAPSSARSASARSSPGPLKNGSGGKLLIATQYKLGGLAVECRKARLTE